MTHMRGQNGRPASGERIAKAIARAGLCSRREAEAWIAAGRVAVNGGVIASPARNVTADDRIAVDGKALPVRARTKVKTTPTIMRIRTKLQVQPSWAPCMVPKQIPVSITLHETPPLRAASC